MKINTNVSSLTAQESSTLTNNALKNSLEKLSSGLKINKASDDASGLAIADKLRTQVTSVNQGIANGNSAIAMLQIADKSMAEQSQILDTVKAKLIQANTDTTSTAGRTAIAKDITKLLDQLNNIAKQTNYNGTTLLQATATNGAAKSALSFQIGESTRDMISTATIQANITGYALTSLKAQVSLGAAISAGATAGTTNVFTRSMAQAGQAAVDTAITTLNGYRGDIGSTQNQIESAVRNLMTQSTNIKNAESVLRDVDYAEESANFNKLNIISQAGSYAISQSNAVSQNVLRLLQ
ncbi:flagellin N-terminal helical domain-containing protein [Arcobacter porcinus]|uniref:flagellin N-terminal helical domain-containing protein n=1 Tax=Arcobacter porcinus TaxID=1935204 RepID=UPI0008256DFB|nr:flagellin [Arcobacter porcinus]OCL88206.1 Flagellar filament 30.7 kDa core protein [Arcobacter porcinus]